MNNDTGDNYSQLDLAFLDVYDTVPDVKLDESYLLCYECSLCWQTMYPWLLTQVPGVVGNVCTAYTTYGFCLPAGINSTPTPSFIPVDESTQLCLVVHCDPEPVAPKPKLKKKQIRRKSRRLSCMQKREIIQLDQVLHNINLVAKVYNERHPTDPIDRTTVWRIRKTVERWNHNTIDEECAVSSL
jgi:hypothetical protein